MSKKDVHMSGALAAVLQSGGVKAVEIKRQDATNPPPKQTSTLYDQIHVQEKHSQSYVLDLSPDKCRPWKYADRSEEEMGSIEALGSSIEEAGQLEPILVRPINYKNNIIDIEYEIIYGHRRWKACKLKNLLVKAIVKDIDDQTAALYQHEENRNREDVSNLSRAFHYKKLLDEGVFGSEIELSKKLNINRNTFNDLMSYTRIPHELRSLIPNIHQLPVRLAIKIATLSKDPSYQKTLLLIAPLIGTKITSKNLERKLIEAASLNTKPIERNKPVIGRGGAELFTIREDSNGAPCIVLHKAARSAVSLSQLESFLRDYIDRCISNQFKEPSKPE